MVLPAQSMLVQRKRGKSAKPKVESERTTGHAAMNTLLDYGLTAEPRRAQNHHQLAAVNTLMAEDAAESGLVERPAFNFLITNNTLPLNRKIRTLTA